MILLTTIIIKHILWRKFTIFKHQRNIDADLFPCCLKGFKSIIFIHTHTKKMRQNLTIRESQILGHFVERLIVNQPHMVLRLERRIGWAFPSLLGVHIVGDRFEILARFVDRLEEQIAFDVRPADLWWLDLDGRFLCVGQFFGGFWNINTELRRFLVWKDIYTFFIGRWRRCGSN